MISESEFQALAAQGFNRIPLMAQAFADLETPLSLYLKLAHSCPPDTLGCPDILLLQCEELAVIDNLSGKLYLIVYADPARPEAFANGKKRLRDLKEKLRYSVSAPVVKPTQAYPAEREFAKADYIAAVERAKELIAAGDFMQVQVGQRIKKRYTESPLSLYRALRSLNPSPYMYYYNFSGAGGHWGSVGGLQRESPGQARRRSLITRPPCHCKKQSGAQAGSHVKPGSPGPGSPVATTRDADAVNEHVAPSVAKMPTAGPHQRKPCCTAHKARQQWAHHDCPNSGRANAAAQPPARQQGHP